MSAGVPSQGTPTDKLEDSLVSATRRLAEWSVGIVLLLLIAPAVADAVRLTDGQVWVGRVTAVGARGVSIESPLVGERTLERARVRAVDFASGLGEVARYIEGPVLLREDAESLPGEVLFVTADQVTINSPVGMVSVDRRRASRLVLSAADEAKPVHEDVVMLADGSILYGRVETQEHHITLHHAELGDIDLPRSAVRWLRRGDERTAYLTDLVPTDVTAEPLVSDVEPVTLRATREAISIEPTTRVRYSIPGVKGKGRLLADVAPLPDVRGKAVVRIISGGRTVLEKSIAPAADGAPLDVELPDAADVTIEVAWPEVDGVRRFPAGVKLLQPRVVSGVAS